MEKEDPEVDGGSDIKQEDDGESEKPIASVPDIDAPISSAATTSIKQEADGEAVAPVVFKKRKGKK